MAGAFVAAMFVLLAASLIAQTVSPTSVGPICTDFPVSITLPPDAVNEDVDVFFLIDDTNSFEVFAPLVGQVFGGWCPRSIPRCRTSPSVSASEDSKTSDGPGRRTDSPAEVAAGRPFILNQPIVTAQDAGGVIARTTASHDRALAARTAPGIGGDAPEASLEALYQVATGAGFDGDGNGSTLDSGAAGAATTRSHPGYER